MVPTTLTSEFQDSGTNYKRNSNFLSSRHSFDYRTETIARIATSSDDTDTTTHAHGNFATSTVTSADTDPARSPRNIPPALCKCLNSRVPRVRRVCTRGLSPSTEGTITACQMSFSNTSRHPDRTKTSCSSMESDTDSTSEGGRTFFNLLPLVHLA